MPTTHHDSAPASVRDGPSYGGTRSPTLAIIALLVAFPVALVFASHLPSAGVAALAALVVAMVGVALATSLVALTLAARLFGTDADGA